MENEMEVFALHRGEDETGISGTGVVAYGWKLPEPNGRVVLAWMTEPHDSVAIYDSMGAVKGLHGHGGNTQIVPIKKWDMGGPE